LLVGGCAVTPDTITHQKPKDKPQAPPPVAVVANGAIFQQSAFRPIFEDHKARLVGDNLTIVITESTRATKSGADSNKRSNEVDVGKPKIFGTTLPLSASAGASTDFAENAAKSANNVFNGTIAVTVIDVTPNGNLIVSGEKQIAMDNGSEYIRFSGVVDPKDIAMGNQVPSTRVADARVEYRTNTHLDKSELMGKVARFFLSVLPF